MGEKLVERNGRASRLTDAGEVVAVHAQRVLDMTQDEVDARGRHGVGFKAGPRFPVDIIEPGTYEYLGQRSTLVRDEDGERVEQRIAVVERAVVDRIGQRPWRPLPGSV